MHLSGVINTIKERREALKVTQEGLAELSGVGLRTIKEFERGKGNPTLSTLQKISDVLGMDVCLKTKYLTQTQ
ncbi:MAG: helix-turn-helix transcriptional regulator [Bacteroidia bacterium]|jgi:transcriptional regulator with XRE-family HTH domain